MSSIRTLAKSFASGELTPELFGRVDFKKFAEGLALCRNFITLAHGPAINRPGTQIVSEVKNSANATRLIPFNYNSTQTYAIEVGGGYFRFHSLGGTLAYTAPAAYNGGTAYAIGDMASSGGTNYYCIAATTGNAPPNATYWYAMPSSYYEIPNAYAAADVINIHYVQSSDVLTLVHPSYPVMELRRYGATNWQFSTPTFSPPTNCPTSPVAAGSPKSGTTVNTYVVTSVASGTLQESVASATCSETNDLTVAGNKNSISWVAPAGAVPIRYNVYKLSQGLYSYIGTAGSSPFVDQNITPNPASTPPIYTAVFGSATNYPAAVSYCEQRRVFGGTTAQPQNLWMTRSGTESDMSYSIPSRDDNSIAIRIAAREASGILHIIPVTDIILLTAGGEWKLSSVNSGAITPTTLSVKPQSHSGANNVTPVIIGNVALYGAAMGGHIRELAFAWQANGYVSSDISLLAPHLFDYYTINDMCYSRGPIPLVWAISSSGKLLGMTYVLDQQVAAWHQHDTGNGDVFEACTTIAEQGEDMLYLIVKRTINGATKRYVERLHTRQYTTLADAFFVDCGTTYYNAGTFTRSGTTMTVTMTAHGLTTATPYYFAMSDTSFGAAPTGAQYTVTVTDANTFTITVANAGATSGTITQQVTTISGLSWLEGRTVAVFADGAVIPQQVVTGGVVTLPVGAAKVTVGLPIQADLQTLPVAMQVDGSFGQGRPKNINKVWLRMYRSSGVYVGEDFNDMVPYKQRTNEVYGAPPSMVSDEIEIVLPPAWGRNGQVCVRQNDPLPLDIAAITMEIVLGG